MRRVTQITHLHNSTHARRLASYAVVNATFLCGFFSFALLLSIVTEEVQSRWGGATRVCFWLAVDTCPSTFCARAASECGDERRRKATPCITATPAGSRW